MEDNNFTIIDINGRERERERERESDDPKIIINAKGKNNNFKIYEPYFIKNKIVISMNSNCNIEIKKNLKVYSKLTINTTSEQQIYIGEAFHCHDVTLFNWVEPYLKIEIGNNCLFSSGVFIRTSDGHSIFDVTEPNSNKLSSVWCKNR